MTDFPRLLRTAPAAGEKGADILTVLHTLDAWDAGFRAAPLPADGIPDGVVPGLAVMAGPVLEGLRACGVRCGELMCHECSQRAWQAADWLRGTGLPWEKKTERERSYVQVRLAYMVARKMSLLLQPEWLANQGGALVAMIDMWLDSWDEGDQQEPAAPRPGALTSAAGTFRRSYNRLETDRRLYPEAITAASCLIAAAKPETALDAISVGALFMTRLPEPLAGLELLRQMCQESSTLSGHETHEVSHDEIGRIARHYHMEE